jgi:hypothetical protein
MDTKKRTGFCLDKLVIYFHMQEVPGES